MAVDIYIREKNGTREIRIPWLPEEIHYSSGGTSFTTYDIMNKGEVAVPTGSGLKGWSWESEFPGARRTDSSLMRGEWKDPKVYHDILEDWRANGTPLTLLVTEYPINNDVYLRDYNARATGGFGDMAYEVEFAELREIIITSTGTTKSSGNGGGSGKGGGNTYTVKKGDCLWKIAAMKTHYGKGSQWTKIYEANKEIIERTAKKYGRKDSSNGHWIYPGTVLTIPK